MRLFVRSSLGSFFILFCIASINSFIGCEEYRVTINADQEDRLVQFVEQAFPLHMAIDTVSYATDVILSEAEFDYLIEIPKNSILSREQLVRALFYLFRKNKFETISVTSQPGIAGHLLHFDLKSYWTVSKVKIHGFLLDKERYSYYYLIENGEPFDELKHKHSVQRIKEALVLEGYCNVEIEQKLIRDDYTKEIAVHLWIRRGSLFRVGTVQTSFQKNQQGADQIIEHTVTNDLKKLSGSAYTRLFLSKKSADIKQYLQEEGYAQTSVMLEELFDAQRCRVNLHFKIELAEHKKFVFLGATFFSEQQLLERLMLFGKSAFRIPAAILKDEIVSCYHDQGFLQVTVDVVEEDEKIIFSIHEGSVEQIREKLEEGNHPIEQQVSTIMPVQEEVSQTPYHFGKTVVAGSSTIPFEYLKRELTYDQHSSWEASTLKQSLRAFQDLDLFDHIHLNHYQGAVPAGIERPMILKTKIDDFFQIRVHTGFGLQGTLRDLRFNGATYKLGGDLLFKNPFNQLDYIIANADFTLPYRILELQYWRPWLLNKPTKTLLQLYNNAFKYPSLRGLQRNLYQVTHQGLLFGISRKWHAVEAGCNLGFEWMETTISNNAPQESQFNRMVARAINFAPNLLDVKIPYLMLEPTLFINLLDDQLYPTQGTLTTISAKGMFPLSRAGDDAMFLKCLAEQSLFVPLSRHPIVFGLRLRLGYIVFQRFDNIMPSERFYLGGACSLRSYQNDLCPPLGIIDNGGTPDVVPQGGKAMFNVNMELRFPLYKQVSGALFQDFGFLDGGTLRDLIRSDVLAGTGFGLRYNTPIGPIRFDMAFKWHKPYQDIPPLAWFLTFGQSF